MSSYNGSSDRILVEAAVGRLVADIAERLFGEVLLDVWFEPANHLAVCGRAGTLW